MLAGLALLLILPASALSVISLSTLFAYYIDKRRATSGRWRIPEGYLHLAEFFGGWPGAFVAQRWFRHKTAKLSYQVMFWLIVGLHQLIALAWLVRAVQA